MATELPEAGDSEAIGTPGVTDVVVLAVKVIVSVIRVMINLRLPTVVYYMA